MINTLNILLMNPPFESANTATQFRMIEAAINKGMRLNIFAYEGAVMLPFVDQKAHANSVKGTSLEQEQHPIPKDMVSELFRLAKEKGTELTWVNCGLCVDERGASRWVEGCSRGSPADWVKFTQLPNSTSLVIGTRS